MQLIWAAWGWIRYLFSRQYGGDRPTLRMIWCRAHGHAGPVWFTLTGLEPDMTCKWCDEDMG